MREWMTMTWGRMRALVRGHRVEQELDEELAFHAAMLEEQERERDRLPADAKRRARQTLGNPATIREDLHEVWRFGALERVGQDIRFALRLWRRFPGFAAMAVGTLALGIGATTVMFSLIDATLLRPFPFPDSERLVIVWETNLERGLRTFVGSRLNYLSWRDEAGELLSLAAWDARSDARTDGSTPERIRGSMGSASLLGTLGIQPPLGRWFTEDEDRPGAAHVAVLGHEYWERQFAADPAVLGRSITINGEPHAIVGVAPRLPAPFDAEVWRPLAPDARALDRGDHDVYVIGRLQAGVSAGQAEGAVQSVAVRLAQEYPQTNQGWNVRAETLRTAFVAPETRRGLAALMGGVALVLLIACANVANLLLVRAAGRGNELAMRVALGAGRGRIVRQLLTESLVLAMAGGLLGVLLATWGIAGLRGLTVSAIPALQHVSTNGLVLLFAIALSAITTVVFGLVPALQFARSAGSASPRMTNRTSTEGRRTRAFRHGFVVAEIALAFVLLIGAGLLAQSVARLQRVPLGFSPEGVLTAQLGLYDVRYRDDEAVVSFFDRLLDDLSAVPGVSAAGVSSGVPLGGGSTSMHTSPESDADPATRGGLQADWRVASADYFRSVGMPLLHGRSFLPEDVERPGRVAVISQALAQQLWPGQSPLGRRMLVSDARRPYEIVGVVGDARHHALAREAGPVMFFPYQRFPWATMTVTLRTPGDPAALVEPLRAAVVSIDPALAVAEVRPMTGLVERAASEPRLQAGLAGLFAALALVLAVVGVYGVMSYSAASRTREVAVRLALGAAPRHVRVLVSGEGLALMAVGLLSGLGAAAALAPFLSDLLFGTSAFDPLTYTAAALAMAAAVMLATELPSRRAMRVDPIAALRHE